MRSEVEVCEKSAEMGTRRTLAPLLLTAGAAVVVVARRRRQGRPRREPPALPPGASPPADAPPAAAVTISPAAAAWPPLAPPVAEPQMPADPSPRRVAHDLALGYVSIPAVDDRHREDLRRQVRHIRRACEALELSLVDLIPDTESDDVTASERPGIRRILRRLDRGDATCLVTTTVERVASSADEWAELLGHLEAGEIRLVVVDDALDTGLDGGRDEAWALIGLEAPGTPR